SYRSNRQGTLPQRSGNDGGCKPKPPPNTPPTRSGSGCFIATAAFGSPIAPEVQTLRSFRDNVLLQTRAGEQFFTRFYEHYYRVSPLIVGAMHENSAVKDIVRWSLVTPIIRYLELLLAFPDAPLAGVDEPWRSFLEKLQTQLEAW